MGVATWTIEINRCTGLADISIYARGYAVRIVKHTDSLAYEIKRNGMIGTESRIH